MVVIMDVCIKNINDEDWRTFKAESAKHGMKIGEFFSELVEEHTERCSELSWNELLYGKKTLTEEDAKNIRKVMKEIRKEFKFR